MTTTGNGKAPDEVEISVKVYAVREIDTAANTFYAEFALMLDWKDPSFATKEDPSPSATNIIQAWRPQIFVENALGGGFGRIAFEREEKTAT
mmetsp:Transcript_31126/g.101440  ORF Transcript_31126/g.101440 Transcript_31126/m.101440 type:complete len:92 (+) Transcript_31126:639-914(+)